jgi:enamine deaminase RidA (YjgF/YER057c/UK114 family)
MSKKNSINPWTWQDRLGFSQAIEVRGEQRVLYCSGQTAMDGQGNPVYPGDMAKQVNQALDNLEAVLTKADLTLADVVRLTYYTTDLKAFLSAAPAFGPRLAAANCKPSSTLLVVAGLFHPQLMIEIEATAVV